VFHPCATPLSEEGGEDWKLLGEKSIPFSDTDMMNDLCTSRIIDGRGVYLDEVPNEYFDPEVMWTQEEADAKFKRSKVVMDLVDMQEGRIVKLVAVDEFEAYDDAGDIELPRRQYTTLLMSNGEGFPTFRDGKACPFQFCASIHAFWPGAVPTVCVSMVLALELMPFLMILGKS
jgi:hypothetical protein